MKGYTAIDLLITCSIVGILAAVVIPVVGKAAGSNEPEYKYIICKDDQGEVYQKRGTRFAIDGSTVIVYDGPKEVATFINMDCWTETETVRKEAEYGWSN